MELILSLVVVILSVILHEVAHGFVADALGDPTARYSGRLTLNPLPHIDPLGSVIIPGLLALTHSPFLIGWAKPVPYNSFNLRAGRWGEALVAGAGPVTNILIAVVFALLLRFGVFGFSQTLLSIAATAVYTNLVLALFNLIPLPPLDGSKVLKALIPMRGRLAFGEFERSLYAWGPLGLILVGLAAVYLLWPFIAAAVQWAFVLLTGI